MILSFDGKTPTLAPGVFVADNATLIGDVTLDHDASVWFQAVLRGDGLPIRVGARTNVQDLVMIHVTAGGHGASIGADVTIGHRAIVHACTVGDRCLIGMGSILLDGCVIGDDCIVGAGAVVPAGVQVPSRSLVLGMPAQVKRVLTERDLASIREFGQSYLRLKETYRRTAC
jgi:carbonic anhydrase/acetyltransferase-like protein (isoleucine patch superfamily)